jgi:DNA-binding transcriptional LysR family regulator
MDWDKLKQFYYVAKAGNFTRAGEKLHVSQSALSRSVRNLEDYLKTKLFQRNTRGVILTKQGEILLDQVSQMMSSIQKAETIIREEETEPQGNLKIAATSGLASLYISPCLPGFMKKYPRMRVSLLGTDIAPDLDLCEADVVIHPFMPHHTQYVQRQLLSLHMKLYASPEYLKEFGIPKTAEELDNHRLVAYGDHLDHPFQSSNWLLYIGLPEGKVREPYAQANSTTSRCYLGEAGVGIITVPKEHPGLEKLNLVEVLPEIEGPTLHLYYIYSKQLKNSKRVLALRDYLEETMGHKHGEPSPDIKNSSTTVHKNALEEEEKIKTA